MQDYATQINDLFNDDSYPPMIIFTGKWGIGKTYYVEKFLTTELKDKFEYKITYLSVLGITSLDDFKDLLIAKRYLEEKHDAKAVTHLTHLLATAEKVTGGSSIISNVIKGSAGAVKHYMLKNISDELFIIDDIERIECPSLKKHIIGECLTLTQSKNKFIFVTDEQELDLKKSFTEKTFSETIIYDPSSTDLYLILKSKLNKLINSQADIETFINMYNLYNLRILNRTLKRLDKLLEYLSDKNNEVNLDLVKTMLLRDGLLISKKYYIDNMKIPEMLDITDEKEKLNLRLRQSLQLNENFVKFIVGKNIELTDVLNLHELPKHNSPLDSLLYNNISRLSADEFSKGLKETEKYILITYTVEVSKFFQCLYYYDYLVKNMYIPENDKITFEKAKSLADKKQFYSSRGYVSLNIANSPYAEIAERYLKDIQKKQVKSEYDELFKSLKSSFQESQLYDNANYQMTPILQELNIEQWEECIKNWNHSDIEFFCEYLYQRYKFVSADSYLSNESNILNELYVFVSEYGEGKTPSLTKGALRSLGKTIQNSLKALKK